MTEMLNQTYGVEIEMYNITRPDAARCVKATLERLFPGKGWRISGPSNHLDERKIFCSDLPDFQWSIESDSSICGRNGSSHAVDTAELVSPVLQWSDMETLQEIIRDLRKAGAKSNPSHQCGVHVHVCGDGHTAQSLRNLTNLMASHEHLLIHAISVSSARIFWCHTVDQNFLRKVNEEKPATLDALSACWYSAHHTMAGGHYNNSRYHMLNLHSFFEGKGIEFRLFQFDDFDINRPRGKRKGGLHAGRMKAFVQLCLALSHYAKNARSCKPTPLVSNNEKYTMRCWLLRLGFIGPEFATAREVLTERLPGDTAWRNGRPNQAA